MFDILKSYERELDVRLVYLSDQLFQKDDLDVSGYKVIFLQHLRSEHRDRYRKIFSSAKERNPALRFFTCTSHSGAYRLLPNLVKSGLIETDPEIHKYYGSLKENLRRLLVYASVTYLGRPGKIEPPVEIAPPGIYHPEHDGPFADVQEFLRWSQKRGRDVKNSPRVVIGDHGSSHALQQRRVVDALVKELEKRGVLAVVFPDLFPEFVERVLEFKPQAIIHTCHTRDKVAFRKKAGVPHLHSLFFRKQSIEQWRESLEGLSWSEFNFLVVSQEILGAIEPQVGSGTLLGGGSDEAFTPIQERIEHLVSRALSWVRLARMKNHEKKIAFIYYDREMGKAELMRGTATGMFMNAPRSMVNVLKKMKEVGYQINPLPTDEDELIGWLQERGRQVGLWAPGVLDKLARSGEAVLVPAEIYREWFEAKVPEAQRKALIKQWGPPPGKFLVWEKAGKKFIVIPRINLGNIILLPQPLKGEAHTVSALGAQVHDKLTPPPHNYLATYFWLQERFKADALVHFGTHGSEFTLPGKAVGLSRADWPDIIMGRMPNINPWIINNTGESPPVKRRAYAVLINHLTPPTVNAELSDELLNLHNDINKWETLEEGALKGKFRSSITQQVREANLDRDLHLDLAGDRLLTSKEIKQVSEYLHDIYNETTPVNLHVFGEPPRDDLLIPYLVTCLRKRFLDTLGEVIPVPSGEAQFQGDKEKYLRKKAEEAVALVVRRGFSPVEAVNTIGGRIGEEGLPKEVQEGFELAIKLNKDFGKTHQEIDNLLAAFNGRFIPPGPANSPDRNPAVVPTGRNMYVLNPEEVPSRPSWEIGKQLVDDFLKEQLKKKGRYPGKIGMSLNSFATFRDYGVMESQILYLMGVRPVWDARNLVLGVELIPTEELGRPRIDVFLSARSYYRDMLPTRMRLLDKAIRLVASLKEKNNYVYENSIRVQKELEQKGITPDRALALSRARMFGWPPGQLTSGWYYYLAERSGEWDSREDLINVYLKHCKYVYTEGIWGKEAPEAYDRTIQGTEVILRSWGDRSRSPLSNKYNWWIDGSLSLAVKHLTGKEPEFLFVDVRDMDRARMVDAEDALRMDYRVRLFNRKWIEGMMKEGYAGADQIAVHVTNTMGWKIMRENSVSDNIWEEIVAIYIKDKLNLSIREWFEAENPYAFQEMTEILLESIRKGYWNASEKMRRELAELYARSVAR
ncbi:MAG TPA: cobaltochelatase subunit CobN, partial [Desulfobacterales bacterium]|nr:cobaltochelatase subunit CobN [Desulfobacterales bacterium]